MKGKRCTYCGAWTAKPDREHVIPASFYPRSKHRSRVQRLTVPACRRCNGSWEDDEVHFRNVALLAGDEPNAARRELWMLKAIPSFHEVDGLRRALDVLNLMRRVQHEGQMRYLIYPGDDERCLRVVRKVVRGLSYTHRLRWPVPDTEVWADVLRFPMPENALAELPVQHRESDVIQYRFSVAAVEGMESAWLLTFFERLSFAAIIWQAGQMGPEPPNRPSSRPGPP